MSASLAALAILVLASGCGVHSNPTPTRTTRADASRTATFGLPDSPEPVAEGTLAYPTETILPVPKTERRCYALGSSMPQLSGRLALDVSTGGRASPRGSYLLDLETNQRISLGTTRFATVAPDGKHIAFLDVDHNVIAVADYEGHQEFEMPSPEGRYQPAYWLDNTRLVVNDLLAFDPAIGFTYGAADGLLLVDLSSNEQQHWLPNLPGQWTQSYLAWPATSFLMFNPDLVHVAYPISVDHGVGVALRDLELDQNLTVLQNTGLPPIWSPDGSRFVIASGVPEENTSELFLVDVNGSISRLTYFGKEGGFIERNYDWSPRGDQIATWRLNPLSSRVPELVVVTAEEKSVVDYCGNENIAEAPWDLGILMFSPPVVWSPDQKYLMVSILKEDLKTEVLLLRLEDGHAWSLAKDVTAVGWMVP